MSINSSFSYITSSSSSEQQEELFYNRCEKIFSPQERVFSDKASRLFCQHQLSHCQSVEEALSLLEEGNIPANSIIFHNLINVANKNPDDRLCFLGELGKENGLTRGIVERIDQLYREGEVPADQERERICSEIVRCNTLGEALSVLENRNIAVDFAIQQSLSELSDRVNPPEVSDSMNEWSKKKGLTQLASEREHMLQRLDGERLALEQEHYKRGSSLTKRVEALLAPPKDISVVNRSTEETCAFIKAHYTGLRSTICFLETSGIQMNEEIFSTLIQCSNERGTTKTSQKLLKIGFKFNLIDIPAFFASAYESGHGLKAAYMIDRYSDWKPNQSHASRTNTRIEGNTTTTRSKRDRKDTTEQPPGKRARR